MHLELVEGSAAALSFPRLAAGGRFPGALKPGRSKAEEGARIMRFRPNAIRRGLSCGQSFDTLRTRFDTLRTRFGKLKMRFGKLGMRFDKVRMRVLGKNAN